MSDEDSVPLLAAYLPSILDARLNLQSLPSAELREQIASTSARLAEVKQVFADMSAKFAGDLRNADPRSKAIPPQAEQLYLVAMGPFGDMGLRLLRGVLKSEDSETQCIALQIVSCLGPKALPICSEVIQCFAEPNGEVFDWVNNALREIGPESEKALITAMKDNNPNVRKYACSFFMYFETCSAASIAAMVELLKDPETDVKKQAAWMLAGQNKGHLFTVEPLLSVLEDPNPRVREYALEGLINVGISTPRILEAFKSLRDDVNEKVRQVASEGWYIITSREQP